jgi:hypothetical protein
MSMDIDAYSLLSRSRSSSGIVLINYMCRTTHVRIINIKISLCIALQRTNATALVDEFFEVIRRTFAPQPDPASSIYRYF